MRFLAAVLLAWCCLAPPAAAHTRSQSHSAWRADGDVIEARVQASAFDVTRLYALGGEAPLAEAFAQEASGAFTVAAAGEQCVREGDASASIVGNGRIASTLRFACPAGALARDEVEIESRLFLRVAPSHLHFVSVVDAEGRSAVAVLTETESRARLLLQAATAQESFWSALSRFFPTGARHVWSGLDHIAFMLALALMIGARWRAAILAASGFTLGHTVTLGLAATGVLRPDTTAIEALIGFTIAFVALAIGRSGQDRMLSWSFPLAALLAAGGAASVIGAAPMSPLIWFGLAAFVFAYPRGFPREAGWLAAIFGLIHGCGFAGALADMDLPRPRILASLLGFNLGVEAGQVVVIAGAVLVGLAAQRLPAHIRQRTAAIAGAALFTLGVYWFVGRLFA
jgi:hypothetical protein